jgi:hypothetical protein
MTRDLIETVARAIDAVEAYPGLDEPEWRIWEEEAKAAILATLEGIREPSEAMIENDEISRISIRKAAAFHSSELPCRDIWQAMIDALRAEIESAA